MRATLNDLHTKTELECMLLKAEHDVTHAKNNARAFAFRAQLATTDDARRDNEGCVLYWTRQADHAESYARDLRNAINDDGGFWEQDVLTRAAERRMGC